MSTHRLGQRLHRLVVTLVRAAADQVRERAAAPRALDCLNELSDPRVFATARVELRDDTSINFRNRTFGHRHQLQRRVVLRALSSGFDRENPGEGWATV